MTQRSIPNTINRSHGTRRQPRLDHALTWTVVTRRAQASASIGPAGTYHSSTGTIDNAVAERTTTLSVPAGQIQRLSVAVIVDTALRPPPAVTAVRAWTAVAVAVGLQTQPR